MSAPVISIVLPKRHETQRIVATHPARFKVISAGRRWGKDVLEVGECVRRALYKQRCWHVTPSFQSADFQSAWRICESYAQQIPGIASHQQKKWFDFRSIGGGWIQFKSAEEPDSLRGEGLDFVAIQEAAHIKKLADMWEQQIRATLTDRKGSAWFLSTPKGFGDFSTFWKKGESGAEDWASFRFPSSSNPYLDPREIEAAKRDIPALVARQEYDAEFVQLAGALFKRENIRILDVEPVGLRWVRPWDLAASTKTTADFTAGVKGGMMDDGTVVLSDMRCARLEWPDALRLIAQTARLDGPAVRQGIETVGTQIGALQTLLREPTLAGISFESVPVHADKITRALPLIARCEQGKLAVVNGPWVKDFLDQLCGFPELDHDDQVDTASAVMQMIGGKPELRVADAGGTTEHKKNPAKSKAAAEQDHYKAAMEEVERRRAAEQNGKS